MSEAVRRAHAETEQLSTLAAAAEAATGSTEEQHTAITAVFAQAEVARWWWAEAARQSQAAYHGERQARREAKP